MPLDYSKWDNIEVSDDEDDTHPNVDTPSLFRWRHKARIEREEEMRKERFNLDREGDKIRKKINKLKVNDPSRKKLEKEYDDWKSKETDMADKERKAPKNVDNMSTEKEDRVMVNKPRPDYKAYDKMTDDEKENSYKEFMENYRDEVKKFGFMSKPKDSEALLRQFPDLVCDHTASYLVVWCIDLEVENKTDLMNQVAHQTISMQFILELAKGLNKHPADCFPAFYKRLEIQDGTEQSKQYHSAFLDELNSFKSRVKIRAKQRLEEAEQKLKEQVENGDIDEEELEMSKDERIEQSPGGLDPSEVFEGLPEELQECFVSRDTEKLQDLINNQTKKYIGHMRDCVLSGLWVPSEDSPLYRFLQPGGENLKIAGVDDVEESGKNSEENGKNSEDQPKIQEIEDENGTDDKVGETVSEKVEGKVEETVEEKVDEKVEEKVSEKVEEKVAEKVEEKIDEKVDTKQAPPTSCLDEVD